MAEKRTRGKRGTRGEGTFRKTKAGSTEYRVSYVDEYGERRQKSFTDVDEYACRARADEFFDKLFKRMNGIRIDATIPDIARQKIENDYKKNYTGEQGYSRNLATIRIIEKSILGNMPIADIQPRYIEIFLQDITRYSNTMISKIYSMLKVSFRIAYDSKIIDKNIMLDRSLRQPKSNKNDKKVRSLTENEQRRFVEALNAHRVPYGRNGYRLQLLIELYSGLRMGEINALKPSNVNMSKGYIHVDSTVSRGLEERSFIKAGAKTYNGVRDVPISSKLRPILEEALDSMKPNPEGLLFYDFNQNSVIPTTSVNAFYRRICEKANVEYNGQHALRHTFATRCIEAGIPPLVLKNWLGHSDIHITLDTYSDVFERMNLGAVEKLDEYMKKLNMDI